MKIIAAASLIAVLVLMQPPAQADALIRDARASVAEDAGKPGMRPRDCTPVGSGIEECVYDVECWEDEVALMSICKKVIVYKPEASDP